MRITADTNVLVRAIIADDPAQSETAQSALAAAQSVAVTLPGLCELAWVLAKGYRIAPPEIAASIRRLAQADNVVLDRPAVEAGLAMLDAGGDFADGVIEHCGRWLGAETFVSFDRQAVQLLKARGQPARLL